MDIKDKIKDKIKNAHYHKYDGIAPEGFMLIPIKTIERLKDFDFWKKWINSEELLQSFSIEDTKDGY
jgi:hypothetical protein